MTTDNARDKPILVTGAAGFIGFHLARRLLAEGKRVIGIDNMNSYYDVTLKEARLAELCSHPRFTFFKLEIADVSKMREFFERYSFDLVIHLAAQAGVRYSLTHPHAYVDSNLVGFTNILEGCRHSKVKHLVFASSSSVYGNNTKLPFSVSDSVDHPISFYAATKKANELMAHTYAHLYRLPCTGLRFFTVYGPWGRPDMALFIFTKAILDGNAIPVYNQGKMKRDFTYIDDIIEGVCRVAQKIPMTEATPYKIYNIGNNHPEELLSFIEVLEKALGKKANKELLPLQPGDVPATYADVDDLMGDVGFKPKTSIQEGIGKFVEWYRGYYQKEMS